jgi:O-antigen ligase
LYVFVGLLSLLGAPDWRDGLNEIIKWLEIGLTLVIAYDEARQGRLNWLLTAILLTGLAQAAIGLWQYQWRGVGPESFRLSEGVYRAYGSFEQPNPFGGFLGLIWPIGAGLAIEVVKKIKDKEREKDLPFALVGLFVSAIILLALYASFSRGAWLGAAVAGWVMAMFVPRRLSLGLGLGVAGLVVGWLLISAGLLPASIAARFASLADVASFSDVRGVNINDANFAIVERLAHWQAALDMARAHPWLGVGIGNYAAAYPQYALLNWPLSLGHAHNIYLNALAETGSVGLLAYLGIWLWVIGLTIRTLRRAAGWQRGLALGLLGVWAHLLAHQVVDNLHVNNIDLLIAAELGLVCAISAS